MLDPSHHKVLGEEGQLIQQVLIQKLQWSFEGLDLLSSSLTLLPPFILQVAKILSTGDASVGLLTRPAHQADEEEEEIGTRGCRFQGRFQGRYIEGDYWDFGAYKDGPKIATKTFLNHLKPHQNSTICHQTLLLYEGFYGS